MALIPGKQIAERMLESTRANVARAGQVPGLAVVLVGNDPGSEIYVRLKGEAAERLGVHFEVHHFAERDGETVVQECIDTLNERADIHGIIVQLPLPEGWKTDELIERIDPVKDADGFHPKTVERYLAGEAEYIPVLPRAIQELLLATEVSLQGESAVALVRSELFGNVIGYTLRQLGLETKVQIQTSTNVSSEVGLARVVVTVCGFPGLVSLEELRPDAVVVDAGISRVGEKVVSDVVGDKEKFTGWVTPLPGGVGPLTIACLLDRVVALAMAKEQ